MGQLGDWPEEDSGSDTSDRYAFQYHAAARHCCELLRTNGPDWVLCEWHTDYAIRQSGEHILVSVKHRDDASWRWTRARLFAEGGLNTLRRRWEDCGRPAECRLVTNSTLDSESNALALACRRGDLKTIRETAVSIAGGAGAEADRLVDFLRVLRIEAALPGRNFIRAANVERYMVPTLDELGHTELSPWDAYDAVVVEVWKASRGTENPSNCGWLMSTVGAQDEDTLRASTFERRKITRARLVRALDKLRPPHKGQKLWHLPFHEPTVKRDVLLNKLTALLMDDANPLAVVTGVHGAGGFGKTVLAQQACARPEVISRYSALLWTTVGDEVTGPSLAGRINDLVAQLGGDRPDFSDPQQAGFRLGKALEEYGGQILLVVDDVWHQHQVEPFLFGGSNCKRLITTRNRWVVPEGSAVLFVDRMARNEAEAVMTLAAPSIPNDEVSSLMELTGRWPVLLGIVGRTLRRLVHLGTPPDIAARKLISQLRVYGPAAIDLDNPSNRTEAVRATMRAGLGLLPEGGPDRYFELAVFSEDIDIPLDALELLWRRTGGLTRVAVERLCMALSDLSLVSEFKPVPGTLRLHDVLRSFLIQENGADRMIGLHSTMLDAAAELLDEAEPSDACRPWWSLPDNQDYLFREVVRHLAFARRHDELRALLQDLRWMESRIERHGVASAEADLTHIDDPLLERLSRSIRQSAHLLNPTNPPASLGAVLLSRLQSDPELSPLTDPFETSLPRPYLSNHRALPDAPDPDLRRTLFGHKKGVIAMVATNDGRLLASLDGYKRLNVWDTRTGELVRMIACYEESSAFIDNLLAPADGTWVATVEQLGRWDGRVRTWDIATGELRHEFISRATLPPEQQIPAAVSADGSRLAIVDLDVDEELLLVNVFDAATGNLVGSFAEREQARRLALSPDGELIVIGDAASGTDKVSSLRLLDCSSGERRMTFHGPTGVNEVTFAPSGSSVYASDARGDVWLWSLQGHLLHRLCCRGRWVHCLMAPDESWLATSDQAGVVQIWDLVTGRQRAEFTGNPIGAALAISPDSRLLAASYGRSDNPGPPPGVRVWDAATGLLQRTMHGHVDDVRALVFAADGSWLASGDGGDPQFTEGDRLVRIWSLPLSSEEPGRSSSEDEQPEFFPKIRWFTADNEKIQIWDSANSVERTVIRPPEPWDVLESYRDDTILLATPVVDISNVKQPHPVYGIDVETGEIQFTVHVGHFGTGRVVIAPDETWFATTDGGVTRDASSVVRIWDAASGALRHSLTGNGEGVSAIAVSPDGSLLVTGDAWMEPTESVARVWCVATGQVESVLPGHHGRVRSIRVANSGDWIATGDDAGNVRIWDTATRSLRHTLVGAAEVNDIMESPNGAFLAVCEGLSGIGVLRIWGLLSEASLAEMRVDGSLHECRWSPDSRLLHATGIRGTYTFAWNPFLA
jgi:WD40 repeat protein